MAVRKTTVSESAIDLTAAGLLEEVKAAIYTILVGGQSYKIGSRSLTRADLAELRSLKAELESEVAASDNDTGLLDNTFVAYFPGR